MNPFKRSLLAALALALALTAWQRSGAQNSKPLSEDFLVRWIKRPVEDRAIVAKLQADGINFAVDSAVVERLKKAGASAAVLDAVQKAGRPKSAPVAAAPENAVTYKDVMDDLQLGIPEDQILKRLEKSPTRFILDAGQVAELKKAGATDSLLAAMRQERTTSEPAAVITDLAIILDCSASMTEKTQEGVSKMTVAKRVVTDMIRELKDGLRVTFIVYGHDKALKCQAVKVIRPLGVLHAADKAALIATIEKLQPVGATPIARALHAAGDELAKSQGGCGLVLFSDGKETCKGDPKAEAETLAKNLKLSFGVRVFGFGVDNDEREALEEIAKAGHGKYGNAQSPAEFRELVQALNRELKEVAIAAPEAEPEPEEMGLDPAVQVLIEQLSDADAQVRAAAAQGLQKLGAKAAAPALAKRVADDAISTVWNDKDAALAALKAFAPGQVAKALLAGAKSQSPEVRIWATSQLGDRNEGPPRAERPMTEETSLDPAVRALIEQLRDADARVRAAAAESIQKLGAKAAVPALVKRVADDAISTVWNDKDAALAALKALAPEQVTKALLAGAKSKSPEVKIWATNQLSAKKE